MEKISEFLEYLKIAPVFNRVHDKKTMSEALVSLDSLAAGQSAAPD